MNGIFAVFGAVLLVILIYFVVGMVIAFPLMLCWNVGMVAAFGLPVISFWEAFCLYFTAILLVKTSVTVNND